MVIKDQWPETMSVTKRRQKAQASSLEILSIWERDKIVLLFARLLERESGHFLRIDEQTDVL